MGLKERRLNQSLTLGLKINPIVVITAAVAAIHPPRDEVKYSITRNNIKTQIHNDRFTLLGVRRKRTNAIGIIKFINAASLFGCKRKVPGKRNPNGVGVKSDSLIFHQVWNQLVVTIRLKIEKIMATPSNAFSHLNDSH